MKSFLLMLAAVPWLSFAAVASTPDVGMQIAMANAQLGTRPGEIHIGTSGYISGGGITLSRGHQLICDEGVTIFLKPHSFIYQSSNTAIIDCIISATDTPISGEVQAINEQNLTLDHVTFIGGGNSLHWRGVKNFTISNSSVDSITAVWGHSHRVQNGLYLENCADGKIDNFRGSDFIYPSGVIYSQVLGVNGCHNITITNPVITGVDASQIVGGAAGIAVAGSDHVSITGAIVTNNPNMDGILTEGRRGAQVASGSFHSRPSNYITISNAYSSYNGILGVNRNAPLALGAGLDIISTRHLRVTNSTINGNGNTLHNGQAGVWLFIDDDVTILNCDISDNSAAGISSAGSRNVFVSHNTINDNYTAGVNAEWQAGTATNVGAEVTLVTGVSGGFGPAWKRGTPFFLNGISYAIKSVKSSTHLSLQTAPPNHSTPMPWGVNSNQELKDSVIDDNGQGLLGGQFQVGISWADGTTGKIIGVTSTNTGVGPQLYGLEIANQASVFVSDDNFTGNLDGGNGIYGSTQVFTPRSLQFGNQDVSTTSLPQTILLLPGVFVTPQVSIQTTGDFAQTNNCGSELAPYSECEIKVTFTPSAAGARKGTLTVTDGAPNSPISAALTGNGLIPSLGLSLAPGASGTAMVSAGKTAQYSLLIGGAGLSGKATLTCSGAPKGAKCELPVSENVNSDSPTRFTVTVPTTSRTLAAIQPSVFRPSPWLWAMGIVGLVVLPLTEKIRESSRRYLLVLPLMLCLGLSFCAGGGAEIDHGNGGGAGSGGGNGGGGGGGSSNPSGTPAGTYMVTIKAASGKSVETLTLTLKVK